MDSDDPRLILKSATPIVLGAVEPEYAARVAKDLQRSARLTREQVAAFIAAAETQPDDSGNL